MKKRKQKKIFYKFKMLAFIVSLGLGAYIYVDNNFFSNNKEWQYPLENFILEDIPEYKGQPYVEVNSNKPYLSQHDATLEPIENYSPLDRLGRCQSAYANICREIMPTKKRENISSVKPSGWRIEKYDDIDGEYLYNRCHLIAYQLSGENANERNLITGTRYMNVEGMLPFENMVADYVKETNHHVLYRVTPVFKNDEFIARGVIMEAYSVEDRGADISFHVFVYNVQPHIEINYYTGESHRRN